MFTTWREYTITNDVDVKVEDAPNGERCLADILNSIEAMGTPVERIILHRLNETFTLALVAVRTYESGDAGASTLLTSNPDLHFIPVGTNMTADYAELPGSKIVANRLPLIAWEITANGLVPWVFGHDNLTHPAPSLNNFAGITLFR